MYKITVSFAYEGLPYHISFRLTAEVFDAVDSYDDVHAVLCERLSLAKSVTTVYAFSFEDA